MLVRIEWTCQASRSRPLMPEIPAAMNVSDEAISIDRCVIEPFTSKEVTAAADT